MNIDSIKARLGSVNPRVIQMIEIESQAVYRILTEDMPHLIRVAEAARDFVEDREEATETIWYHDGRKGKYLLETLGITYVEKS